MSSYSVQIRLRRTTVECAYILVPVTSELMTDDNRIDPEKLMRQATDLGRQAFIRWYPEELRVEPHPIQKPCDPGEEPSCPG
jgi:hypothetical protein